MTQTPLQQLIEKLNVLIEGADPHYCAGLEIARNEAQSLLPDEEQFSWEAFEAGRNRILDMYARHGTIPSPDFPTYYSRYETKDKTVTTNDKK